MSVVEITETRQYLTFKLGNEVFATDVAKVREVMDLTAITAIPRTPATAVGRISGVRVRDVTGRTENSVRVCGTPESRIRDVVFDRVAVTLDRWTRHAGGRWDNRPTSAVAGVEPHRTSALGVRYAAGVTLRDCRVAWGEHRPDYFAHALEADHVSGLAYPGFAGEAAHPLRDPAIAIRP